MTGNPKSLIINTPYQPPRKYWDMDTRTNTFRVVEGRRPATYDIFDTRNNTHRAAPLDLVNRIRERVDSWREAGYPGITSVTRALLEHWHDPQARELQFYFCQREAIETLIWKVEALANYQQGIAVPGDGGEWERLCSKMATGSGKTVLMGMIISWQTLNALTYPKRNKDFSRAVFVVAPGLTVKSRLQVLHPGHPSNVYDEFNLCPNQAMRQRLNQVELEVENWHTLMPLKDSQRSVVKKGNESGKAFVRRVAGKIAAHKNIVVINDEAHHAYRQRPNLKISKKEAKEFGIDLDEATRWIDGLDRIHKECRISRCFDLSATPFAPTGGTNSDKSLFDWVISDFGLNDAIEAGLVKTPRMVVRDGIIPDSKTLQPKLYHLYREKEVQEDLNRKGAQPHETLPQLVQKAYTLLGADWLQARKSWAELGHASPPVLLTVCNRTETAARIERYLTSDDVYWPELRHPNKTMRVDSRVLEKAGIGEKATANKANKDYGRRLQGIVEAAAIAKPEKERLAAMRKEELLRELVDTVGKRGKAGQDLQAVVSVAMLSEGWDAKNVTHIMGLRAFTSQLLCEQVIGRGLRRVSYEVGENGLFVSEFVNVFGVPLPLFLPASEGGDPPPPPKPSTQIETLPERNNLEIKWPNVLRIDTVIRPTLTVDWSAVPALTLDPSAIPITVELAPMLGGETDLAKIKKIDLEQMPAEFRLQRLVFRAARKAFDQVKNNFKGNREYLLVQLIRLIEQFMASEKIYVPSLFHQDPLKKRILMSLAMDLVVGHLLARVREQNEERLDLVFDAEFPIGSTRYMRTWYSTKPNLKTQRSQISHVVGDSAWEGHVANVLEISPHVMAYAKNDHLGFQVYYLWQGSRRRFIPDFLVRLTNGMTLVLEVKGQDSDQNKAKRDELARWVKAVNAKGGFGEWCSDVLLEPSQIQDVLERHIGHCRP